MQVSKNKYFNNMAPFKGLQENMAIGKVIIRDFHKEYGHLKSNTWLSSLEWRRLNNNQNFSEYLYKTIGEYDTFIYENVRESGKFKDKEFESLEEYINQLRANVKLFKAGNCGEQADIVTDLAQSKNIKPKQLLLDISQGFVQHCVNIFGHEQNFTPAKFESCGENAVIIDTFFNEPIKAKDAEEFYRDFFCCKEAYHSFELKSFHPEIVNHKLIRR